MKHAFPLIGICWTLLGTAPAVATVSTSASAQVAIKLVDLDPDDGVAPSLSFGGGVRWDINASLFDGAISGDGQLVGQSGEGWAASINPSIGFASANVSSQGDLLLGIVSMQGGAIAEINATASAFAGISSGFVISPRTRLEVTVQGHLAGSSTGDRYKDLTSQVTIELSGAVGDEWIFQNPSIAAFRTTPPDSFDWTPSYLVEQGISASFANTTGAEATGELNVFLSATSRDGGLAAAVPEPAMWLSILFGLGGLGLACRGRCA